MTRRTMRRMARCGLALFLVSAVALAWFGRGFDVPVSAGTALWGDVDGDGEVTSADARLVLQYYAEKLKDHAELDWPMADVDGDGEVTSTDAQLILQYYAGKITRFPVEWISPVAEQAGEPFEDWDAVAEVSAVHGITRFGFAVEDNSGLPFNVACYIGDTEITAVLPSGVDLTALRARFTFRGRQLLCDGVAVTENTVWDLSAPKKLTVVTAGGRTRTVTLSGGATTDSVGKDSYTKASVYLGGGDAKLCDYAMEEPLLVSGKIKGRGNSSWLEPKKSYTLKLDKKASLLGMSCSKGWALVANYDDKSLLRNVTASALATEAGVTYVMKVRPVDLWLNGDYWGTYNLTEKVDVEAERVNISDVKIPSGGTIDDVAADTVGYLLEFDSHVLKETAPDGTGVNLAKWETYGGDWKTWEYTYYDEYEQMNKTDKVYYNPETDEQFFWLPYLDRPVTIKDPDPETLSDAMREYIFCRVRTLDSAIQNAENNPDRVAEWLDLDAFMRWCVVEELADNTDSCFYSSVYMTLDADGKFVMGPVWDFDRSMGNCNYYHHADIGALLQEVSWCRQLLATDAGVTALQNAWSVFSTPQAQNECLNALFRTADGLRDSAWCNFERWEILERRFETDTDEVAGLTTWDQQVSFVASWLENRFAAFQRFMDTLNT